MVANSGGWAYLYIYGYRPGKSAFDAVEIAVSSSGNSYEGNALITSWLRQYGLEME